MGEKVYGSLRLTKEMLEELKDLKLAFESCYMERLTFDEFMRKLIAAVEDGEPGVWETFEIIRQKKFEKGGSHVK